jgi:hypothetical protein
VGAVAINPALYEKLRTTRRDLVPVSLVVNNVEVLVVGAERAVQHRRRIRGGREGSRQSADAGVVGHRQRAAPGDGTAERRREAQPAARAVQGRRAGHHRRHRGPRHGFFGDIPGLIGHIKSGKLKAIGIAAPKRHPLLPR